jgi:hypothetical protein
MQPAFFGDPTSTAYQLLSSPLESRIQIVVHSTLARLMTRHPYERSDRTMTKTVDLWCALFDIGIESEVPISPHLIAKLIEFKLVKLVNGEPILTAYGQKAFSVLEWDDGEIPELARETVPGDKISSFHGRSASRNPGFSHSLQEGIEVPGAFALDVR